MKKILAILAFVVGLSMPASAVDCPGGSAFELRRPSDNVPVGCIDTGGRLKISSVTFNGIDYDWPDADGAGNARLTTDGAGQLSWTAGGGGDVTAAGNNIFSATNTFNGETNINGISNHGGLTTMHETVFNEGFALGPSDGSIKATSPEIMYITSADGATQSSGCYVALTVDDVSDSGTLVWSSTTTLSLIRKPGVLMETCDPGDVCAVAVHGVVRARTGGAAALGQCARFASTRCVNFFTDCGNANAQSFFLSADDASATPWAWIFLSR